MKIGIIDKPGPTSPPPPATVRPTLLGTDLGGTILAGQTSYSRTLTIPSGTTMLAVAIALKCNNSPFPARTAPKYGGVNITSIQDNGSQVRSIFIGYVLNPTSGLAVTFTEPNGAILAGHAVSWMLKDASTIGDNELSGLSGMSLDLLDNSFIFGGGVQDHGAGGGSSPDWSSTNLTMVTGNVVNSGSSYVGTFQNNDKNAGLGQSFAISNDWNGGDVTAIAAIYSS